MEISTSTFNLLMTALIEAGGVFRRNSTFAKNAILMINIRTTTVNSDSQQDSSTFQRFLVRCVMLISTFCEQFCLFTLHNKKMRLISLVEN